MLMPAAAGFRLRQRPNDPQKISRDGRRWRQAFGHNSGNAARLHAFDKTLPSALRDEDLHPIQRMLAAFEMVDGLILGQIDARRFHGILSRYRLVHQEAGSMTGMARNGGEILTGDGEFHEKLRQLTRDECYSVMCLQAIIQGRTEGRGGSEKTMPHKVIRALMQDGLILTDGGMGTALQARGLSLGAIPEIWNITQPEDVAGVTAGYAAAGARLVLSNTFGANRWRLREHARHISEINQAGVLLARKGAAGKALVFASIGPSGKRSDAIAKDEMAEGFAEQIDSIAKAKPDGLVIETMTQLGEALIALDAAKRTDLPVIAAMTFGFGTTPEDAIPALIAAGADVVGANCGNGPVEFSGLCSRIKEIAGATPVWMKPNAGLPKIENGKARYDLTPQDFASHARALRDAGANFIGGCCGTTADHIRAIREKLF